MIIKSFEISKLKSIEKNLFLLYGENDGFKNQLIKENFEKKFPKNIYRYEENEVLSKQEDFYNSILSKSFFDEHKLIIISRVSSKILNLIEEIIEKKIEGIKIILNAGILEKNSKLRKLFEKNKETICIPFYSDNEQTLNLIAINFFQKNKIPISQQARNLLINRCRGNRQNLNNELNKIENYIKDKKKINIDEILKLTNLAENYSISELIDNCLAKNKIKTINILNENNYSTEDCVFIIRTLLIKSKRLLKIKKEENNQNIEEVISFFKPPIFWKEKEIVKQQAKNWTLKKLEDLIYKINEIELLIKKNSNSSINILFDFIIEQTDKVNN